MRVSMMAIAVATCASLATGAHAQSTATGAATDRAARDEAEILPADIIVTAQKRSENLQDVPLAITALSSAALESRGVNGVKDLAVVPPPGLFLQPFAGASQIITIDMRGIVNTDAGQGTLEPGVAVYLDDVYLGRAQGLGSDLADPERIEVLRGPQGTLFGRNAEGGALRIVSRKPSGEFSGRGKVTIGDYGLRRYEAHVDLPAFAGFSLKFDYLNSSSDGYTKNGTQRITGLADQKNFGYEHSEGYRGAARWKPVDALTIDYSYDYSKSKSAGDWWYFALPTNPSPLFSSTTPLDLTRGPESFDRRRKVSSSPMFNEPFVTTTRGHTLTAQYDLSDKIQVKSITAWRATKSEGSQQLGSAYAVVPFEFIFGGPVPAALLTPDPRFGTLGTVPGTTQVYGVTGIVPYAKLKQHQFSQEVQLLGSTDTLQWVVGGYYFRERLTDIRQTFFSGLFLDTVTDGGFSNFVGTNPFSLPFPGQGQTAQRANSRSYAAFGQATWSPEFADGRLHLTGGLRYTNDRKDAFRYLLAGSAVAVSAPFAEQRVDPAVTVAYDVTPDVNAFARFAQAYRAGGVSVRDPSFTPFGAEVNKAYEIGVKMRMFDRRATLNFAGYYNDVRNRQLNTQLDPKGDPAQTKVVNAPGSSPVWGIELEFSARVAEGLDIGATYAYQDGRLDAAALKVIDPNAVFYIPNLPRNSGAFTVDYVSPQLGFGKIAVHGDYSWADKWNGTPRTPLDGYAPPIKRNLANARISLQEIPVGLVGLTVTGFVRNVFNKIYPLYNSPSSNSTLIPPRVIGAEVGLKF